MDKLLKTSEVKEFITLLKETENVVITAHVRPDGDAVGSTLGLWHLLRTLNKAATVVLPDSPPRSLSFLPGFKEIAIYTKHRPYCERVVNGADLIICCDFNKASRQDTLASLIQENGIPKVMIDHHQQPDDFAQLTISYPGMSSTCELVFRLIAAAGLYGDLNLDASTCLLTGMITDTQNFSVNCKNNDIYEILQRLLDNGCDKTMITRKAFKERSYSSLRLESYALANKLEIFEKTRAAVITLDRKELEKFRYERGDTEGLVNKPLEIRGVVSSFFLREDPDCIKVSARSINDFPVSKVCEDLFDGGGHLMASGGEFHGTLEECRKILVDALPDYEKYVKGPLDRLEIFDIND